MFRKSTLLSTVASVTLIGSILALGFMAAPAVAADGPTYVFRLQQKLLTPPIIVADADSGVTGETGGTGGTGSDTGSDGSGDGSGGDGSGDGSGDGAGAPGNGIESITPNGFFDAVTLTWPTSADKWEFECQTANWHDTADKAARLALLRSYKGGPALATTTKRGDFSFRSDAYEFDAAPSGQITFQKAGDGLGTFLPPCHNPYSVDYGGDLWRVKPLSKPATVALTLPPPTVTTRRLNGIENLH